MNLEEIRKKVDIIDEDIVRLIAERMSYVSRIKEYKNKNNLPIYDAKREADILDSKKIIAKELGVDSELVEKVFSAIMEVSRKAQEK